MVAIVGRKQLTYQERKKIFRSSPRSLRSYKSCSVAEHQPLIHKFTKDLYQLYEKLLHAHKRVDSMVDYCYTNNIQGPILELAMIRDSSLTTHQKIMNILRHIWTDAYEVSKEKDNTDSDKFWLNMSLAIQRRCQKGNIHLHTSWEGLDGRLNMVKFFKKLYEKQNGKCALSNEPITLTVGIGSKNLTRCSPDRKNSDRGYTPDNLWFVSWRVNQMKMDTNLEQFLNQIWLIATAQNLHAKFER